MEVPASNTPIHRIAWTNGGTSSEVIEGTTTFDVVLRDTDNFFAAYGDGGSNAVSDDGGDSWTPLTDVGSNDLLGGVSYETRRVMVGDGALGVKDAAGNVSFACSTVGGAGTKNQTNWHIPCVHDTVPKLYEVARFETSRFVAVGEDATIWSTGDDGGGSPTTPLDPDVTFERWLDTSADAASLFTDEERYPNGAPDLFDVARVGDGVVAVGQAGTVIVRAAGFDTWKRLELENEIDGFEDWTLRGVASDDVLEYIQVSNNGADSLLRRQASIVIVGHSGVSAHVRFFLDDFNAGGFETSADVTTIDAPPWGEAHLTNVAVDERSRVVVGMHDNSEDKNVIFSLPHEEAWDALPMWVDLQPTSAYDEDYLDVATDGQHYVAVGRRHGSPDLGIAWGGEEDVHECTVVVDIDGAGTWTNSNNTLTLADIDLDEALPDSRCQPLRAATPVAWSTVAGDVEAGLAHLMLSMNDWSHTRAAATSSVVSSGLLDIVTSCPGCSSDELRDVIRPVIWRVNLVDDDGGNLTHYRVTVVSSVGAPYHDVGGWRRIPVPVFDDTPNYDVLGNIPFIPDGSNPFVDAIYGVSVSGGAFAGAQAIIEDETEDICGVLGSPLIAWDGFGAGACATGGVGCTDQHPDRDPTVDPDVVEFFAGISRLRSSAGHSFVDAAESADDGQGWRYQSMKHYILPRCDVDEVIDNGDICVQVEGSECEADSESTDWRRVCCDDEEDANGHDLARITYIPLYAPITGTAYVVPDPEGLGKARQQGVFAEQEIDDCRLIAQLGDGEEIEPGDFRTTATLPDHLSTVFIFNEDNNLAIQFDHIENCVFDPAGLPSLEAPEIGVAIPVVAGDRIGRALSHGQFDIVAYVRDQDARWRKVSYFELLPTGLYNLYRQQFDLGARLTDAGENSFGAADDPIISVEDRDECPIHSDLTEFLGEADGVYDPDFPAQIVSSFGTCGTSMLAKPYITIH
jgi:hypothetical protein